MVRIDKKLKGTTLIETLVAMTLIVIAISFSFSSLLSIQKSFNNDLRSYAFMLVNRQMQIEEADSNSLVSKCLNYQICSVCIERILYNKNAHLSILTIRAVTPDSIVLYEVKELVRNISKIKKNDVNE
jgi:Tfp pilus assembly protein PilV